MDLTRSGLRAWLREVLARTGDTPTSLARKAGIAQSTLTRFLNEEEDGPMLTLRTVSKIAHVVGMAPEGFVTPPVDIVPSGLREGEAVPLDSLSSLDAHVQESLDALTRGRNAADVWRLTTSALAQIGYLPGDFIVVDLGIVAEAGDVVCAQHYAWPTASAETIFRIYEPPYLVAAGNDPALRRPLVVDGERVIIKGVVTELMRTR